ncbi:NADPH:quinone reductase [Thalassococcus sp. S3]|uniref:NADPH:quinone reductase n=1 Tax=Thalassococcus sp. S3 TaxID=2017482 RepID=UPI0010247BBD|nr:NADPH:quinone reductase [Thalassococcus sp. S3]QBF33083.1 zinc-binding dehydrogenase [Thalassococcus sp. S3]
MKAITYRKFGAARDVLEITELAPVPPGPGEVQVRLSYSGVNPSDVKARAGARAGVTELPFPVIVPHSDGAGDIVAIGSGVPETLLGTRVWIWNGQWRRAFGTAAEFVTLPAKQAVAAPAGVSLPVAATLGIPGLTAVHTVLGDGPVRGKTVLIQGGAGTVGYLAVQIAKWAGARVIATAREDGLDRVRQAGPDAVIDFTRSDLAEAILKANDGKPIDRIVEVEFGLNAETDAAVIAENGRISAYGSAAAMVPSLPFYPLMFKAVTLEMALVYALTTEQRSNAVSQLNQALEDKALEVPIAKIFDFENCAAAHEMVEQGHRAGSVLVRIAGDD